MKHSGFPGSLQLSLISVAGLFTMGIWGGNSLCSWSRCLFKLEMYQMPQQMLAPRICAGVELSCLLLGMHQWWWLCRGVSVLILAAVQKCILKHVWRVFLDLCMFQGFMGRKDKVEHPAQMLVWKKPSKETNSEATARIRALSIFLQMCLHMQMCVYRCYGVVHRGALAMSERERLQSGFTLQQIDELHQKGSCHQKAQFPSVPSNAFGVCWRNPVLGSIETQHETSP